MASAVTVRPLRSRRSRRTRSAAISPVPCGTPTRPSARPLADANALTSATGEVERTLAKAQRRPLPSSATGPSPEASDRPAANRVRQVEKAAGSSSRNSRENVSCEGTPPSKLRNSRRNSSFERANSSKSTQLAAPHSVAESAIVRSSSRSCRRALPRRGSGSSPKQSRNKPIERLQPWRRPQNPSPTLRTIPNAIPLRPRPSRNRTTNPSPRTERAKSISLRGAAVPPKERQLGEA